MLIRCKELTKWIMLCINKLLRLTVCMYEFDFESVRIWHVNKRFHISFSERSIAMWFHVTVTIGGLVRCFFYADRYRLGMVRTCEVANIMIIRNDGPYVQTHLELWYKIIIWIVSIYDCLLQLSVQITLFFKVFAS